MQFESQKKKGKNCVCVYNKKKMYALLDEISQGIFLLYIAVMHR